MSANDPKRISGDEATPSKSFNWLFALRTHGLRFGMRLRARAWPLRTPCRDDPVGLGSSHLQIFQECLRTADELHVVARRKLKRDSDFLYERYAIARIKTVGWLRIFAPSVHESKHRAILFVADRKRKMRLAHLDVIIWHRDDKTFYRFPQYGRRDRLSREAEVGLYWFSVRSGRSTQRDIGVGKCDAESIGSKMVRIELQRDFGARARSQGQEKQRGQQQLTHSNIPPPASIGASGSQPIFVQYDERRRQQPRACVLKYLYLKSAMLLGKCGLPALVINSGMMTIVAWAI
jgi:hypothetical protein